MATLISPYTDLVLAAAGIVAGGLTLAAVLGRPRALSAGVTLAVAVLVTVLLIPGLFRQAGGLDAARAGLRVPGTYAMHEKCFHDGGRQWQLDLLVHARERIPEGASYSIDSSVIDRACFQLSMLPRRLVRPADEPEWTVRLRPFPPALRERIRQERSLPAAARTVFVLRRDMAVIRGR